jgi:hypothetical protein
MSYAGRIATENRDDVSESKDVIQFDDSTIGGGLQDVQ